MVGGRGRCCRVRGLVMGFPLVAAGGGTRGGVCRWGIGVAGVGEGFRVVHQWSGPGGGGQGGMVWGWHCWWRGGAGGGCCA